MKRHEKKELMRQEATERNEAWAKLSPQQQLDQLDLRLGKNVGAKKQRNRLNKKIKKLEKELNGEE